MSLKTPDKKQPFNGCQNSHSSRRRKKETSTNNACKSPPGPTNPISEKNLSRISKEDPGALILKLLHNGRKSVGADNISRTNNTFRSQSRTEYCSVSPHVGTSSKQLESASDSRVPESSAPTSFTTPPQNRKGRYSLFSTCGTNNQKCISYSSGGNGKSLTSSNPSNPTNFALPMYMRSPNPENIPMPCGFPIEG